MPRRRRVYFSISIDALCDIGMGEAEFGEYETLQLNYGGNSTLPVGTKCVFDEIDATITKINYWADDEEVEMVLTPLEDTFPEMMLRSLKDPKKR